MRNLLLPGLAVGFFLTLSQPSFAQEKSGENVKWVISKDVIEEGVKLYNDEKYAEAIAKFNLINRNDSLYSHALYDLSLAYIANKEYDKAAEAGKQGIALKTAERSRFYANYGSALDLGGKPEEALKLFDEAILLFPLDMNLLVNKGITLHRMNKDNEAIAVFQRAAKINPFYPSAHYYLGVIAAENGKMVPAMLSLQTFLLMEHYTERTGDALVLLDKIAKGEYVVNPDSLVELTESPGDFETIETLVKSKISISAEYSLKGVKTDYTFIRPVQMVFEKLKYKASDKGFWMQYYVPLYTKMWEDKQFKAFTYYILGNLKGDQNQKNYTKSKSAINTMLGSIGTYFKDMNKKGPDVEGYTYKGMEHWYYNGDLVGVGSIGADGASREGQWYYFYDNGALASSGKYVNAKKEGRWEYYYTTGVMSSREEMKNDQRQGAYESFYQNGAPYLKTTYQNGEADGRTTYYYATGQKKNEVEYAGGKITGVYTEYYNNGNKQRESAYKDGKLEGPSKAYYETGEQRYEILYTAGNLEGPYKSYYRNGNTETTGNYTADKREGEFVTYYENKNLKSKETFKADKHSGTYTGYYNDGKTKSEEIEYKDGEETHVAHYDMDGKIYNEFTYENGSLQKVVSYDKSGRTLGISENKKGTMAIVTYDPEGWKSMEGQTKKSYYDGVLKYYFPDGTLEIEEPYADKELNGVRKEYYANGKLYETCEYKDGKMDGYFRRYYQNGQLRSEGYMKDGNKEGEWLTYFSNGILATRDYYVADSKKGYQISYNADSTLRAENFIDHDFFNAYTLYRDKEKTPFVSNLDKGTGTVSEPFFTNDKIYRTYVCKAGDMDGVCTTFYPTGQIKEKLQYKNGGYRDGDFINYYADGKKHIEGKYVTGWKEGLWAYYYRTGQKSVDANYLHGDYDGLYTSYWENGKKEAEGAYKQGNPVGYHSFYAMDGTLQYRVKFNERGEVMSYSYLGKDGNMLDDIAIPNQTGKIVAYFPNGNKSAELEYRNNLLEGAYAVYNTSGKPALSKTFRCSEEEGKVSEYREDGSLRLEESYINGELNGPLKLYNEKGKLEREITYLLGDEHGTEKIYTADGKLRESHEYAYGIMQN